MEIRVTFCCLLQKEVAEGNSGDVDLFALGKAF